jgi:hypothetical protein
VHGVLVLQYQNSTAHTEVNGVTMQVRSKTFGSTWEKPTLMDPFLGKYAGVFPGPGNGVSLSNRSQSPGRIVFAAWGVTRPGNQETNYNMVYFTDDGGHSYSTGKTAFPANLSGNFEEPAIAETQNGPMAT